MGGVWLASEVWVLFVQGEHKKFHVSPNLVVQPIKNSVVPLYAVRAFTAVWLFSGFLFGSCRFIFILSLPFRRTGVLFNGKKFKIM
jgi:hypothetical protein